MPLILESKFNAVLSQTRIDLAGPETLSMVWFGLIVELSFFVILTVQPFIKKISFANCVPAKIPFCREIILAEILLFVMMLVVMSPFPMSSDKNLASSFFVFIYKTGFLCLNRTFSMIDLFATTVLCNQGILCIFF